jgi:hypothetical protein
MQRCMTPGWGGDGGRLTIKHAQGCGARGLPRDGDGRLIVESGRARRASRPGQPPVHDWRRPWLFDEGGECLAFSLSHTHMLCAH